MPRVPDVTRSSSSGLADVLDVLLDKGLVIGIGLRFAVALSSDGIESWAQEQQLSNTNSAARFKDPYANGVRPRSCGRWRALTAHAAGGHEKLGEVIAVGDAGGERQGSR